MGEKISFGPWGGRGGDRWTYKPNAAIQEIVIHHSCAITSISFKDSDGYISGTFGGHDPNDKGEKDKIIICCPREYLKSISGNYGVYKGFLVIKSLSFHTNLTTYGPFGDNCGEAFSLPMEQSVVVGFHGSAGYYLDSIGIYVPARDSKLISVGLWGGSWGDPWTYVASQGIDKITIYAKENIKSISFKAFNGLDSGAFAGRNPNDIGEKHTITINCPSEYFIAISGTFGQFANLCTITSLSFTTNETTYGPYGSPSDNSFSIPINAANKIVGFHGLAGHYLNAIGIYVGT